MNEFENLVYKMRIAQSRYFANRTKENLIRSKNLETLVDEHFRKILNPNLFE